MKVINNNWCEYSKTSIKKEKKINGVFIYAINWPLGKTINWDRKGKVIKSLICLFAL